MRQFSNIAANQIIPKDQEGGEGGGRVGEKEVKANHQRWNKHRRSPASTWTEGSSIKAPPDPALSSATSLPTGPTASMLCSERRQQWAATVRELIYLRGKKQL